MKRLYMVFVKEDSFSIDAPIGRKNDSIIERIISEDGKQARTSVQVLKRFTLQGHNVTHVRLTFAHGTYSPNSGSYDVSWSSADR